MLRQLTNKTSNLHKDVVFSCYFTEHEHIVKYIVAVLVVVSPVKSNSCTLKMRTHKQLLQYLLDLSTFRRKTFCFSSDYFFSFCRLRCFFVLQHIDWIFWPMMLYSNEVLKLTLCDRTLILIGVISPRPLFLVIAISLKP